MRIFLYILLLALGGCNSSLSDATPTPIEDRSVSISITPPVSRSLSNTVAETWEKKVNSGKIYIFNSSGNTVYVYTLTTSDINTINNSTNKNINFIIPGNLSTCDVYFVANSTPSAAITNKTSFLSSFEQDISSYNGTFANVTTSATRTNGFVMTGSQDGVTLNPSQTTNLSLSLKRIVAKVSLAIKFTAVINLGTITLNNVVITQSSPYSFLFPATNAKTGGSAVTFTQAAQVTDTAKIYRALFYVYENDARPLASNRINIYFNGQGTILIISTDFAYNVKINGDISNNTSTGKITRNRMYYIRINVTKLTTILGRTTPSLEVSMEESDW